MSQTGVAGCCVGRSEAEKSDGVHRISGLNHELDIGSGAPKDSYRSLSHDGLKAVFEWMLGRN
jgi:hypothetical protein